MARNNESRFSKFASRVSTGISELVNPEKPTPRASTRSDSWAGARGSSGYEVSRPDDQDYERFWNIYKFNPIVNRAINYVSDSVMEPGWYLTADAEDTVDEMTEYMENIGVYASDTRVNFSKVGKQAVIQHMVRGTYMAERMQSSQGLPNGINPVQFETFEVYTKPDSSVLLAPDDYKYEDVVQTENNKVAAYVQWDPKDSRWSDRKERRFARDEIIRWPRNPDVGDVFGESIIQPIANRADALELKLQDNDDAIAMKAWPMILFQLGTEDSPFSDDEIEDFMNDFRMDQLQPGSFHGVGGDVDITEFAGETADIQNSVDTDVDFIMSAMPGPRYSLGSFNEGDLSENVAAAQERQFRQTVRRLRKDLEDLFTPYLSDVAQAYTLDNPESIQLHIGRPEGDVDLSNVSGNVIRYTSDVDDNDGAQQTDTDAPEQGETGTVDSEAPSSDAPENPTNRRNTSNPSADAVPDMSSLASGIELAEYDEIEEAELADPRLVSTTRDVRTLTNDGTDSLEMVRDRLLAIAEDRLSRGSVDSGFDVQYVQSALTDANLRDDVEETFEGVVQSTVDTLGQPNHGPEIDVTSTVLHTDRSHRMVDNFVDDVEAVANEMLRELNRELGRVIDEGASFQEVREIITDEYDRSELRSRVRLIARMSNQDLLNTIKLAEYERSPKVDGYKIINPCTGSTREICTSLSNCGDGDAAEVLFDSDDSLAQQIRGQTDVEPTGTFDPLSALPPHDYGCRCEIAPVVQ